MKQYDLAVIGTGIVGMASARCSGVIRIFVSPCLIKSLLLVRTRRATTVA